MSSAAGLPRPGSLDRSFGSGGVVTYSLSSGYASIDGIAVQPDGKIVVAGGTLLARYLPDGSPDPSFGNGGHVDIQAGDFAGAVALQPDGKLVIAGDYDDPSGDDGGFMVARYKPDGSVDTSFGTSGVATTDLLGPSSPGARNFAAANALLILPGGKIIAAGNAGTSYDDGDVSNFALVRYTSDGSLDPSFAGGGIVQTGFTGYDRLGGIVRLPSGKVVATGAGYGDGHADEVSEMLLARYAPDGSVDGTTTTSTYRGYYGGPPTLQRGKIVVAGFAWPGISNAFPVLARFKPSGALDATFGKQGFAQIRRLSGNSNVQGVPGPVVVQSDGKILVAAGVAVARLLPNGQLDKSFGVRGIASQGGQVSRLALQADKKILVGGTRGSSWILRRLFGDH